MNGPSPSRGTFVARTKKVYDTLIAAEKSSEDLAEEIDLDLTMEQRSGELYDILCQVCVAEALVLVRSVQDLEGIRAWQVLWRKYNPKIIARGLRMMLEVVSPAKVKELSEVETAVAKWEEKIRALSIQFEENLSGKMKMAIYTSMLPRTVQEYVYVNVDKDITYANLRDKVRGMVANRTVGETGPVPVDVGRVGEEDLKCGECGESDDTDVNGVNMNYQCRKLLGL